MDAHIYCADIYCLDCGIAIRNEINAEKQNPSDPDDETTYDSDEYPKGPYPDGGGEADSPQHCGNNEHCLNRIVLKNGTKVGCFLENPLTSDGYHYVQEELNNNPDSEIAQMWAEFYGIEKEDDDDE